MPMAHRPEGKGVRICPLGVPDQGRPSGGPRGARGGHGPLNVPKNPLCPPPIIFEKEEKIGVFGAEGAVLEKIRKFSKNFGVLAPSIIFTMVVPALTVVHLMQHMHYSGYF